MASATQFSLVPNQPETEMKDERVLPKEMTIMGFTCEDCTLEF